MINTLNDEMKLDQFSIKEITNNLHHVLVENKITIIEEGKIIKNKNQLLGEGSFGKVYKGTYGKIEVAIKKLKLHQMANIDEIMQEIKAVSTISHPQVPKFYGVWKTDKYLHLIFDYIDGVTLKQWFQNNSISNKQKVDIMIKLVDIIEKMHGQGIIHRDLKPENILIMKDEVYVIDFGVSKISVHTQTGTNNQKGTVAYFGPENCSIDTGKDVNSIIIISPKYDIWSIGCIISFIFSNQPPWSVKAKLKKTKEDKGKENKEIIDKESSKEVKKIKETNIVKEEVKNGKETKEKEIEENKTDKTPKKQSCYEVMKDYYIIGLLTKQTKFPIPKILPQEIIDILLLCFEYNPNNRISANNLGKKLRDCYNSIV